MASKHTYRTWIGAFLLLTYVFIATPVHLWHQHKYIINHSTATGKGAVSDYDGKTVDAKCQICSHHYSVYANDTHSIIEIPAVEYAIIQTPCIHSFPAEPYFHISGRGPPAF